MSEHCDCCCCETNVIHFVKMSGGMDTEKGMEWVADELEEMTSKKDNIIITSEQMQPMTRKEAMFMFEEMAEKLDIAEKMEIDWAEEYKENGR